MWVRAMHSYYLVCKVVAPKRAQLAEATAQLEEVMIELNGARAKLAEVIFNFGMYILYVCMYTIIPLPSLHIV